MRLPANKANGLSGCGTSEVKMLCVAGSFVSFNAVEDI
jgi:hypothetical protein